MLPVDYVAFITAFFASAIANYLVRDLLYSYSAHSILWLMVFLLINLYLIVFLQARNYLYNEKMKKSLWFRSRQEFLQFLYSLVLFVFIGFFFETAVFLLATNELQFTDYLNFANFGVFFIFVFVRKVQSVVVASEKADERQEQRQAQQERQQQQKKSV